jgi:hypothetical protein
VGIAARDTDDAMRAFVDEFGLEAMPTLVDDDGDLWGYYGVLYQPAWVFVAPDGSREVVAGALFGDALNERLTALADQ